MAERLTFTLRASYKEISGAVRKLTLTPVLSVLVRRRRIILLFYGYKSDLLMIFDDLDWIFSKIFLHMRFFQRSIYKVFGSPKYVYKFLYIYI